MYACTPDYLRASNQFHSILYESHRPFEWTFAILENLAILSQGIQTYAFGNTKYQPIAYVAECKVGAIRTLIKTRIGCL
jgi:hypothetical protein